MDAKELFDKHTNFAYKIANKYFNYPKEREDIIQQALLGLWIAAENFDGSKDTKFMTFAGICINNSILMYLKKIKKHIGHQSIDAPIAENMNLLDFLEDDTDYIQELEEKIELDKMRKILDNLDLKRRNVEIFKLLLEGKKQHEVAKIKGVTQPVISRIKKRVEKKIREIYLKENGGA